MKKALTTVAAALLVTACAGEVTSQPKNDTAPASTGHQALWKEWERRIGEIDRDFAKAGTESGMNYDQQHISAMARRRRFNSCMRNHKGKHFVSAVMACQVMQEVER